MTAATNKALDLYPAPNDLPNNAPAAAIADRARAIMLRSSILSDEWPRMVRAFSQVMGLDIPDAPGPLDPAVQAEHVNRMMRELNDLAGATTLLKQADEAFDMMYLAVRVLVALGLTDNQILAGFTECHAANMTKVLDDGRPLINDGVISPEEPIGKALKTHNYVAPDYATAMGIKP